jgi:hypothetical protein
MLFSHAVLIAPEPSVIDLILDRVASLICRGGLLLLLVPAVESAKSVQARKVSET